MQNEECTETPNEAIAMTRFSTAEIETARQSEIEEKTHETREERLVIMSHGRTDWTCFNERENKEFRRDDYNTQ